MSETPIDPARFDAEMTTQAARLYRAQRWIGPIGTAGAAGFISWPLWGLIDRDRLIVWLGAMVLLSVGIIVSFSVPWSARRLGRSDVPILSEACHLGIGAVGGLLAWIDHRSFTDDTSARMSMLCYLFAMTLGVSRGSSALGRLVVMVAGPMWALMIVALFAAQQFPLGFGLLLCAGLLTSGQIDDRRVWRELVSLRVAAAGEAERRREESRRDPLTGLRNRPGAVADLEAVIDRAGPTAHVAALFIDLDRFKPINDRYGHSCGDRVLIEIAGRLAEHSRPGDVVSRIGGDEFLVLLSGPEPFSSDALAATAERLVDAVEQPVVLDMEASDQVSVSASIGIAISPVLGFDANELIRQADRAMYQAKRADDPQRKVVLHSS